MSVLCVCLCVRACVHVCEYSACTINTYTCVILHVGGDIIAYGGLLQYPTRVRCFPAVVWPAALPQLL